jgi:hypothetical protein
MSKQFAAMFSALALSMTLISPCLADEVVNSDAAAVPSPAAESQAQPAPAKDEDAAISIAQASGKTSSKSSGDSSFATQFASFAVGTVVGIPIASVRKTIQDTRNGIKDITGENKWLKILLFAPGTIISVPFACISGPVQGAYFGTRNSLMNCNEPFSKDAFSLGDMP